MDIFEKARIVQTHAFERFRLDQPTGLPAQAEPQSWSAELCDLLEIMKCYVENFSEILFKCSIDTWKRIATLYHDLLPNESGLDYFIDLVRRDCLDETVSLINLNKSIGFVRKGFNFPLSNKILQKIQNFKKNHKIPEKFRKK